jgi:hypothetical protein
MKPYIITSSVIFALVALLHLVRLLAQWDVTIGNVQVPMWVSIVGLAVAAFLSLAGIWAYQQARGFRLSRARPKTMCRLTMLCGRIRTSGVWTPGHSGRTAIGASASARTVPASVTMGREIILTDGAEAESSIRPRSTAQWWIG